MGSIHIDRLHLLEDFAMVSCLHEFFEQQVERTPEAVAVVFEGWQLSYAELNRRANQLAHYLRDLGVGPDVLVGVYVERSLEMLVALLGILKAGGAYVPLDPAFPRERLVFMINDSRAPLLLTQQRLRAQLPASRVGVIALDTDWDVIARHNELSLNSGVGSEALAYVIYTSGSTGLPKGVAIEHRSVVNFLTSMRREPGLRAGDRLLAVTTLSFDIAGLELYLPLAVGACVEVVSREVAADPAQLRKRLTRSGATVMQATPASWRMLVDVGWEETPGLKVLCGGEALGCDLANALLARAHEVWNMYGPTETTIWSTAYKLAGQQKAGSVVPLGRPIANTQLYVLDEAMQPVPAGVAGELYIGGAGLARGYLNRPELTAEKFMPNPFGSEAGDRLYRTGDLTRYLPDGRLEFLGRVDHQVKIRGYRVELGEVEAVLQEQPGVRQAVVLVREDVPGDKRLVGYVVVDQQHPPTVIQLRRQLAARVPDYIVPSTFVLLDKLPLTPNGKIDRQTLPAPGPSRPELEQAYVAPRTRLEQFLAGLWCEVLKLDRVGIYDNFFDLGGNSIQGATFINKLQQHLREPIFIVALFDASTVAAFAAFLRANYSAAMSRILGPETHARMAPHQGARAPVQTWRVDAGMIEQMRQLIAPLAPHVQSEEGQRQKNPPAIFVLAPPRSGTTLLRVMLAGHPQLFAAAELQLLGFNTLGERRAAFSGKYSLWLEGAIRAVMQIQGCDADQAKRLIARYEDQDITTKQFYRVLQDWIAPRTLVDKSPSYALDLETLKRAESDFEEVLYIHLVRHPYAMIRSFERYRMEQVFFTPEHPFSARELAELIWVVSHQNIVEFLSGVPKERQHRMCFEDLIQQPQAVMEQMCRSLSLAYHPSLIEPYKHKEKKMTDGIYAASAPMGDRKFNEYQSIDPKVAESWKEVIRDNFLGEVTWEWAERLGYEHMGHQAAPGSEWKRKRDDSMEQLDAGKTRLKQLYQRRQHILENGRGLNE
jgi:amino acid adenylation domain-containing protein